MISSRKKEEVRRTSLCKLCGNKFTVESPYTRGTSVYCLRCSIIVRSNYKGLEERDRSLRCKYVRSNYEKYGRLNLARCLFYTKRWKKANPSKNYLQKKRGNQKYSKETLDFAENHYTPWGSDEVEYIREKRTERTARDLAIDLGRSYNAIIMRASKEKILLMTEDKKHNRLITGRSRK